MYRFYHIDDMQLVVHETSSVYDLSNSIFVQNAYMYLGKL